MYRKFIFSLAFLFLIPGISNIHAQVANKSILTIEKIMQRTENWRGTEPDNIYWGTDNQTIYFDWNPEQDTLSSLYKVTLKKHLPEKVSQQEKEANQGRGIVYNSDRSKLVFLKNGNLFIYDLKKNTVQQLTNMAGRVSSPSFTTDSRKVTFTYNQNLYWVDLSKGLISQLTDFVAAEERTERKSQGQALWLEKQQMELFDVLKERELMRKTREYRRKAEEPVALGKIYLGKDRLGQISLSPNERYVVYTLFRQAVAKETSVTHFVTTTGYTEERTSRTKVGSPQNMVMLSVYDRTTQKSITVKTDNLPGIQDLPDFWEEYPDKKPTGDKITNRTVNLSVPVWNNANDLGLVVARAHDNKDRWICLLDPESGTLQVLDRQRDEAWIAGPGISGFTGSIGWLPDNETVWFQSEESGYSHLTTLYMGQDTFKMPINGGAVISGNICSTTCWLTTATQFSTSISGGVPDMAATGGPEFTGTWEVKT
jgi:hypothetical protein